MRRLDRTWSEEQRFYSAGGGGIGTTYNASMLTIHAIAAERGHDGPSRNDERGRLLAARMLESPPFFDGATLPHPDTMFHTPGWVGNVDKLDSPMDKAYDPKVAESLTAAWRARAVSSTVPNSPRPSCHTSPLIQAAAGAGWPFVSLWSVWCS